MLVLASQLVLMEHLQMLLGTVNLVLLNVPLAQMPILAILALPD
jgi:hypothetical protein